jgi:hypothetical protein
MVSIQRYAAPDVCRDVKVLAMVNGRFALFETASGNNLQRQLTLAQARSGFALAGAASGLLVEKLLSFFGSQRRRRGSKT